MAPADVEHRDQAERQERAGDGAEVVHGAFEAIRAAVDVGGDDVGEQRVAGGTRSPRAVHAAARKAPTCQALVAAPIRPDSTAVVV